MWKELPKGKLGKGEVDRGLVIGHSSPGKEFEFYSGFIGNHYSIHNKGWYVICIMVTLA